MTDEMKAEDATRYLVVAMDNGNGPGAFKVLAIESSEGTARKCAEAEADKEDGRIVGVFQKIGTARTQRAVVWKGVA